jgi:hypothetical protein
LKPSLTLLVSVPGGRKQYNYFRHQSRNELRESLSFTRQSGTIWQLFHTSCAISPPSRTTHEFCETPIFSAILPDSWRSDHSLLPVALSGAPMPRRFQPMTLPSKAVIQVGFRLSPQTKDESPAPAEETAPSDRDRPSRQRAQTRATGATPSRAASRQSLGMRPRASKIAR